MRNNLRILLILLGIFFLSPGVSGAEITFDELDLQMTVPEGWYVITQQTDSDAPVFRSTGIDPEDYFSQAQEDGICMTALSADLSCRVSVSVTQTEESQEVFSYSDHSTARLEEMARELLLEHFETRTATTPYMVYDVYLADQLKYITTEYSQLDKTGLRQTCIYSTIYNGQNLTLTALCTDGSFSDRMDKAIKKMVDSLHFTQTEWNPNGIRIDLYPLQRFAYPLGCIAMCIVGLWVVLQEKRKKQGQHFHRPHKRRRRPAAEEDQRSTELQIYDSEY